MKHFEITETDEGFDVQGFPDAVKVIGIKGPKARRLGDIALHVCDLEFSLSCLDGINLVPEEPSALKEALWRSSVIHFLKCFGNSGCRFSLDANKIYRGGDMALEIFNYFQNLRNKYFVHDENSFAQALPGAILNKPDAPHKIAKIICPTFMSETLDQGNFGNLHKLVTIALEWATEQFDQLCDKLSAELESLAHEDLSRRAGITYSMPSAEEVHESNTRRQSDLRGG